MQGIPRLPCLSLRRSQVAGRILPQQWCAWRDLRAGRGRGTWSWRDPAKEWETAKADIGSRHLPSDTMGLLPKDIWVWGIAGVLKFAHKATKQFIGAQWARKLLTRQFGKKCVLSLVGGRWQAASHEPGVHHGSNRRQPGSTNTLLLHPFSKYEA